ncbi:MAG: sterol desaturase family protein [Gammaproteobacteria bacterium]|jgi:sterol desaturase/sphingolipid hydroxylase (fatty acid hydroxylase superfamily)
MYFVYLILGMATLFFIAERIFPGRKLPHSYGWYARAIFLNLSQFGIILLAGITWDNWFQGNSLLNIAGVFSPIQQGLLSWFIGTFVFYWWHRARHKFNVLWIGLHQIHHSASRIEILTSFYKHPLEIAANSMIISFVLFVVLGASPEAAGWFNLFAAAGELFYHSNLKTPHWVGYFMQRPEHHSIHHQFDVHDYNYGDITWWDRLFGTFRDTREFTERCGFREGREEKLGQMLVFKDVY